MKQRLLFLMAFMLLLGTITKAQTTPVINALNISVTYGAASQNVGASLIPAADPTDIVTWNYSSSRPDIVDIDQTTGMLSFEGSTSESGPVTITINASTTTNGALTPKTITVTVAPKNLRLLPPQNAVQQKTYDGTTTANLIQSVFQLNTSDLESSDIPDVSLNFTGVVANFETKDVGTNKRVFLNQALSLQGSRAFCYTLTDARPELTGTIVKGNQPADFGLSGSYSRPIADLKLELTPNVKETFLNYQITGGDPSVINVSIDQDNKITINFLKTGTTAIKFFTNATGNYNSGEASVSITVQEPTQANDFTLPAQYSVVYGETGKTIVPTGVKDGAAISYSINPPDVATISTNGTITTLKAGIATVTVKSAATLNYRETTQTTTLTVTQKSLTIVGVSVKSKTYDGTTAAELVWTSASLNGIVSGDNGKVTMDYSPVNAAFVDANAGSNKSMTLSGTVSLTGDKAGSYSLATNEANLSNLNLKGTISQADQVSNLGLPSSVTVFVNQPYALDLSNVLGSPNYAPSGTAANSYNSGTQSVTFSSATSATAELILTATDANGNYKPGSGRINFTIKAADVVVFENTEAQTIEYGEENVPLGVTAKYSGGTISSLTYTSSDPTIVEINATTGLMKIKAASGSATITVYVAANLPSYGASSTTVRVNAERRKLTLTGISINNKVYDGTTTATVSNWSSVSLARKISGDDVEIGTAPTFTFKDKNVGNNKEIVVNGGTLTGTDASKYSYSATSLTANITPKDQANNLGLPTSLNLKYGEVYTFAPTIAEVSTVNTFYTSNATGILEIDNTGKLIYKGVGTATITVRTEAKDPVNCNYNNATATIVVTVTKGTQIITIPSSFNKILSEGTFTLTPTAYDNPTFIYEAINNDNNVIAVNSSTGVVTLLRAGTAAVLITAQETALYGEKKQSVTITITEGVAITTQPQAQTTVCVGNPFTLSVVATGAVSYQWYKGAVAITGATSATYTVQESTLADAGNYTVRVQGVAGTNPVTSTTAVVTVGSGATITTPLANKVYCQGDNVILTVGTSGTGLTYRWYRNGSIITDATTPSYTINNIQAADTALYRVDVTGTTCNTATVSSSARVGMTPPIPTVASFYQVPAYLTQKNYDTEIIVGDRTRGYEGVSKYTWSFSTDADAFTSKETTTNSNIMHVTPNTRTGVLSVVMTHPCGNRTLTQSLQAVPTGINDITAAGVKVYPNPVISGSTMTVDLGNDNTGATVYIYNVTGSLTMNANLKAQMNTIPVNLKPGVYMMKIVVPNGKTMHHKFIVK
ncbi:MAG: YDG domain-containing protein [Dysgonamonadaceae bacterium]|jgi:hypothetical protein|nr:YDG domain-containing protein [Dysgonamonadaceae bacterium]